MKTKLIRIFVFSILITIVTACATDGTSVPLTEIEKQINHIFTTANVKPTYFIEVPSPNNIISEKIMLAAISVDGSSSVNTLDNYLKKNASIPVGIVGKSQAVNVATVKQSLKNMTNKQASGTIYLIASDNEKAELEAANKNNNINVVVVSVTSR